MTETKTPVSARTLIGVTVISSIFGMIVGSIPGVMWAGKLEQRVIFLEASRARDDLETQAWRNRYDDKLDSNRRDSAIEHNELLRRLEEVSRAKR